jgi:ATP-dependent DNA helicase RecQ
MQLKERAKKRLEWVLHYTESRHLCRSRILLSYFGEKNSHDCEQCDVCIEKRKSGLKLEQFEKIYHAIKSILIQNPITPSQLKENLSEFSETDWLKVLQFMIEQSEIYLNKNGYYQLTN